MLANGVDGFLSTVTFQYRSRRETRMASAARRTLMANDVPRSYVTLA